MAGTISEMTSPSETFSAKLVSMAQKVAEKATNK
jgi:hypothetical protein